MQSLGRQHMGLETPIERHERGAGGADLIGERRKAERHAFAGVALGLAVPRLMLAALLAQQPGEEAWASPDARHDLERRSRLGCRPALPQGEMLAHGPGDLPMARDNHTNN